MYLPPPACLANYAAPVASLGDRGGDVLWWAMVVDVSGEMQGMQTAVRQGSKGGYADFAATPLVK